MKNKLHRLTHKVLKSFLLQMEVFHPYKKKDIAAPAHVKERQTKRERAKHIWGLSCSPKALALWREREGKAKISSARTHRVHGRAGGLILFRGKPGLTLVKPTATAEATTQNEIPRTSLAHVRVHNYFDWYTEQNTRRQTYIVWPQSGGFRCVICSPFPTFAQLCLWSGSNVDSCGPVT